MKDDDKYRDKFNPGVTDEQIRNAEKMLGSFNVPTFVEKRDLGADYRAGVLRAPDVSEDVMISASPVAGEARHVLLSRKPLGQLRMAEVNVRRLGQIQTMTGWVEEGHEGRRAEDKLDGDTLYVSFFHPER